MTAYDEVIYPNGCQSQTHPNRLSVIASLFGLDTAPPENCRVLELGCGDGSNLLPLAYPCPRSSFVGIDLASIPVTAGQQAIAELGLKNIRLEIADISKFPT